MAKLILNEDDWLNMDKVMADLIVQCLKEYRKQDRCMVPEHMTDMEEWHNTLDEMIWCFQEYQKDFIDAKYLHRITLGVMMFSTHMKHLWDVLPIEGVAE